MSLRETKHKIYSFKEHLYSNGIRLLARAQQATSVDLYCIDTWKGVMHVPHGCPKWHGHVTVPEIWKLPVHALAGFVRPSLVFS